MGLQQDNWLISLVAVLHHVKITPICEWDCNMDREKVDWDNVKLDR